MNETLTGHADHSDWRSALYSMAGVNTAGSSVVLTINSQMQAVAEAALQGYSGSIVVMDPATGAVLAKASSPSYTHADLGTVIESGTGSQLVDRTTQALYSPGSSFKTITLSAGIDTHTTTLDTTYSAPGTMELGGGTIHNYANEDMGTIPLREAFARSSNTALAQLGVALGADNLVSYARAFGYGTALWPGLLHYTIADAKSCRDDHLGAWLGVLRPSCWRACKPCRSSDHCHAKRRCCGCKLLTAAWS